MIGLAVATAVIIGIAVVPPLVRSVGPTSGESSASGSNGVPGTVPRPGYEGSTEADPAPLVEVPNPAPSVYRGRPVVQACNLLALADLAALGIRTATNPRPNVVNYQRTYLAADGTAPLTDDGLGFNTAGGFSNNRCNYGLHTPDGKDGDTLEVVVSQPGYVQGADGAVNTSAGGYERHEDIGPVQVYSHRLPSQAPGNATGDGILRLGSLTVDVGFNLTANGYASKILDITERIARNVQAQAAAPTGLSTITYQSPAFPMAVAQPCPLLTPGAVTAATGAGVSPLVVENPATSIGQTYFGTASTGRSSDSPMFAFTTVGCERGTGEIDPGDRRTLSLEITSYLSDEPAKMHIDFNRGHHAGVAAPTPLGDEATVLTEPGNTATHGVVMIRKGRFVFDLRLADDQRHPDGLTEAEADTLLVPAAQQILATFAASQ